MDTLGMKVYVEQKYYCLKTWLGKTIGVYKNIDKVTDYIQLALIIVLLIVALNK